MAPNVPDWERVHHSSMIPQSLALRGISMIGAQGYMNVGYRRLQRWVEQQTATENGLTAAQFGVLFLLGKRDGALIGEVAEALDLVPSAMTGLADRMERAGLVQRRPDGADGRATRVHLTPAGQGVRKRAATRTRALNGELMKGFSEKEIEVVSRWLTSLQTKFPKNIS